MIACAPRPATSPGQQEPEMCGALPGIVIWRKHALAHRPVAGLCRPRRPRRAEEWAPCGARQTAGQGLRLADPDLLDQVAAQPRESVRSGPSLAAPPVIVATLGWSARRRRLQRRSNCRCARTPHAAATRRTRPALAGSRDRPDRGLRSLRAVLEPRPRAARGPRGICPTRSWGRAAGRTGRTSPPATARP